MSKAILNISGTVGRDAEIKPTSNGYMARFAVATNSRQKDQGGNWNDVSSWFDCTVFAKSQEWLQNQFFKGAKVFVSGELVMRQWTDKNGNPRLTPSVTANHAEGLTKPTAPAQTAAPVQSGNDFDGDIPFMRVMGPW